MIPALLTLRGTRLRCLLLAAGCCLLSNAVAASVASGQNTCWQHFSAKDFPFCAALSETYTLHWALTDNSSITFAVDLAVPNVGWLGLGVSEGSAMMGADIIVLQQAAAAADSNSNSSSSSSSIEWTIGDYFSESFSTPQLDAQQDASLVSVEQSPTATRAVFLRPLSNCDPQDMRVVGDMQQMVIFAYGQGEFRYHGPRNRGYAMLTLAPSAAAAPAPPPKKERDVKTLTISMPRRTPLPNTTTAYLCVNHQLPAKRKHHILQFEGVVGNTRLVHHMLVYACAKGQGPPPTPPGQVYDCLRASAAGSECMMAWLVWAPGTGTVLSEKEAALPFGKGSTQFITLQIHYTNPEHLNGEVDSSGFKLKFTRHLKPYDMGVLTLGSQRLHIPPGLASYQDTPNLCPGRCTARFNRSLTLVTTFLHMHMLGRSIVTRVFRGGLEVAPLGFRKYYHYDYQGYSPVPPEARTLQPGDELLTTCVYDSRGVSSVTKFGASSYDEMCFSFVTYYPAVEGAMDLCTTVQKDKYAVCGATADLIALNSLQDIMRAMQTGLVVSPGRTPNSTYQDHCGRRIDI